jgi:hypothetical protein
MHCNCNFGPSSLLASKEHHFRFYESNLTLIHLILIFISCSSSEFLRSSLLCCPSLLECGYNEDRWWFLRLCHNATLLVNVGCTEVTTWKVQQLCSLKQNAHETSIALRIIYFNCSLPVKGVKVLLYFGWIANTLQLYYLIISHQPISL